MWVFSHWKAEARQLERGLPRLADDSKRLRTLTGSMAVGHPFINKGPLAWPASG